MDIESNAFLSFKKFLQTTVELPDDEWEYIKGNMSFRIIEKGDFLLKPGEKANFFAYLFQGLLYSRA